MKIESTDITISKLLSQGWYKIPRFQRPYSWVSEQISEFWNDTVIENNGEYFIGSMVIFESENSEYGIVDGQQRLTTLTIMLCALRDILIKYGFTDLANGVHTKIERTNLENKSEFVLKTETSYPYFQGYIQSKEKCAVYEKKVEEERNIKFAYDFFSHEIEQRGKVPGIPTEEGFKIVRDSILNLKVVLITLGNEDDAYLIFEILNARGQNLSASDLIKNYIFRFILNQSTDIDLPQEQWKRMVATVESVEKPVKLDEFLYHHWLSRHDQVTTKDLYKAFKADISIDNAQSVLKNICSDATLYAQIVDANPRDWEREEVEVVKSLDAFTIFSIKMHLPAALSLYRSYRNKIVNLKNLKLCLKYIEKFHFIFTAICSRRSSGSISKMYSDFSQNLNNCSSTEMAVKEIDNLKSELRAKTPSYDKFKPPFLELNFRNGFTRQKKIIDYILRTFYRHENNGISPDKSIHNIEHIMPQSHITEENYNFIGGIGNLIIVPDLINTKLANKNFFQKKKILIENQCVLPRTISESESWGFKEITNRVEEMAYTAYHHYWKI